MNPGPAGLPQLEQLIIRIINLSVGLALIALLAMLVTAGFKYLTSGGDAQAVKSAAQTLTWALLGVLFLMLAFVILLIIRAFTGVDVLQFSLNFGGPAADCNNQAFYAAHIEACNAILSQ